MLHHKWTEIPKERLNEALARKIVTGEKVMLAQVFLTKGAVVPEHHHESEQLSYVLEGALRFELDGREEVYRVPLLGGFVGGGIEFRL